MGRFILKRAPMRLAVVPDSTGELVSQEDARSSVLHPLKETRRLREENEERGAGYPAPRSALYGLYCLEEVLRGQGHKS
jgi:hypothetical protein